MRRSTRPLATAAAEHRTSLPRNLRALKDEQIASARRRIFGPQGSMPGDRFFRKNLEGKQLMRWYFPSKYALQDFRVDEYFEMQAERFKPREPHQSMAQLEASLQRVMDSRDELRSFFQNVDKHTFLETPALQDLYGLFRLVDPDPALSFKVSELVFKEHGPMFSGDAPLRIAGRADNAEEDELQAVWRASQNTAGGAEARGKNLELDAKLTAARSKDEAQEAIQESLRLRKLMPDFKDVVVAPWPQDVSVAAEASGPVVSSATRSTGDLLEEDDSLESELLGLGNLVTDSDLLEKDESLVSELLGDQQKATTPASMPGVPGLKLGAMLVQPYRGGSPQEQRLAREQGIKDVADLRTAKKTPKVVRQWLAARHRFVDPMFRRRRLKWLERQMAGKNKEKEVKYNSYYVKHPDDTEEWPTNKGSVTVKYPSPYH